MTHTTDHAADRRHDYPYPVPRPPDRPQSQPQPQPLAQRPPQPVAPVVAQPVPQPEPARPVPPVQSPSIELKAPRLGLEAPSLGLQAPSASPIAPSSPVAPAQPPIELVRDRDLSSGVAGERMLNAIADAAQSLDKPIRMRLAITLFNPLNQQYRGWPGQSWRWSARGKREAGLMREAIEVFFEAVERKGVDEVRRLLERGLAT